MKKLLFVTSLVVLGLLLFSGAALMAVKTTNVSANLVAWKSDGMIGENEYQKYQKLGVLEVYSRSDKDNIMLGIQAPTTGYLALGISPEQMMNKADMILMCVKDGKALAEDMYSTGIFGPHPPDTTLGGTNDLQMVSGTEKDGVTVIELKRKLNTGDKYDKPLTLGKNKVIWATSDSDDFAQKHNQRGAGMLEF
ncbi:MAG TPA: DOMON domain-containing protein [Bacillota bacterium]|nr:DOMON domain-containing protein [Bacillota bacterium]